MKKKFQCALPRIVNILLQSQYVINFHKFNINNLLFPTPILLI